MIKYFSTNGNAELVSFSEALLQGQAPDKGLYMPTFIPELDMEDIAEFMNKKYHEIAFEVVHSFLKDEIAAADLSEIVKDAYNFDIPIETIYERKHILRLDGGPTASFKDFAARLMARLMQHFLKKQQKDIVILTATSGDTGSAVAHAFYGLDNIKVIVLYPANEVSDIQRKQMTTLGKNIRCIAVNGKFDDCQDFVKTAFADDDLKFIHFSSANSINIGRLIPQSVYYFYAYSRLWTGSFDDKAVFSVPSGNFGDLMGGIIAKRMGLPVDKFVIATNANDTVPNYLKTGIYKKISPSRNCISTAMNVGHPSNMARIVNLYGGTMYPNGDIATQPDMEKLRSDFYAVSIDDETTKNTIINALAEYDLILEPHGAVGWAGLHKFFKSFPEYAHHKRLSISLETAHPAKFSEDIQSLLGIEPDIPACLIDLEDKEEDFVEMEGSYKAFKDYLKKSLK